MKKRDYGSYLEDIIEHMNYAEEFIRDMTFDEFKSDKKTVLSKFFISTTNFIN